MARQLPQEAARDEGPRRAEDRFTFGIRVALATVGLGLVGGGVAAVFQTTNDVGSASLLASGVALLFVAYAGPRIAHLKAGNVEVDLAKAVAAADAYATAAAAAAKAGDHELATRLQTRALQTLRQLTTTPHAYEKAREELPFGPARTRKFDEIWREAVRNSPTMHLTPDEIRRLYAEGSGDRIQALACMYASPDLVQKDLILEGAGHVGTWNEHYYMLRVAAHALDRFTPEELEQLRDILSSDTIRLSVQQDPPRQRLWEQILGRTGDDHEPTRGEDGP